MVRIKRQSTDSTVAAPLPTSLYSGLSSTVAVITSSSPTTTYPATGTQPPAQAAAKKHKEPKPSSCTPSPTTSMAPSASKCLVFTTQKGEFICILSVDNLPVCHSRWQSKSRRSYSPWTWCYQRFLSSKHLQRGGLRHYEDP